jgi:hypothetical protein
MSEEREKDATLDLYKIFPFMEAFPFEEYKVELEEDEFDISKEVSPMLVKTLGTFGPSNSVNFQYIDNDSAVLVSFQQDDISYLASIADSITHLNSVSTELENGIAENDIENKVKYIKRSRKFLKLLMSKNLEKPSFEPFLVEMLKLNEAVLESNLMLELHKLKPEKILKYKLTEEQRAAVFSYLNFQLHYCRILLGIVIAIKIF